MRAGEVERRYASVHQREAAELTAAIEQLTEQLADMARGERRRERIRRQQQIAAAEGPMRLERVG